MQYKFNKNYFDEIDTEEKAYWIGFIWCDGYLGIRNRGNRKTEYNLNVRLMEEDKEHLEKLNKCLEGNYPIKIFPNGKGRFKETNYCRLFITNRHLGETLSNKYGIIPHRLDCSKLLSSIPNHLIKHFIRGCYDADGSFSKYQAHDNTREKEYINTKYNLALGTTPMLVDFVEEHFIEKELISNMKRAKLKRHKEEGRDIGYINLSICGKGQFYNCLDYLYKDSKIYLDRKYEKYLRFSKEK